jgi:cytochrome P450
MPPAAPSPAPLAAEPLLPALLALLLVAALLLPRLARSWSAWRRWRAIPGPPAPHALLGHAPHLNTPRAPMWLLEHAETYGDIFRLRLAHRRAVVVGDAAAFALLTKRAAAGGAHARLPKDAAIYAPLDLGVEGRPHSLLTEPRDSPVWSCVRKAIAPAFSASALRARVFPPLAEMLEQVVAHLRSEHARLSAAAAAGGQGGGACASAGEAAEVDAEDLAKRLTADIIHVLLFSQPLGGVRAFCDRPLPPAGSCGTPEAARLAEARAVAAADRILAEAAAAAAAGKKGAGAPCRPMTPLSAEDYVALVEGLLETARRALGNPLRRPLGPLLRLLGDRDAALDAKLEAAFGAMMRARVAELESDAGAPPEGSLARAILGAIDPSTGKGLPANRRASELAVTVNAGFETSSRAIVCTLAALAEHPEAQERLAAELAAAGLAPAAPGAAAAAAPASPSLADKAAAAFKRKQPPPPPPPAPPPTTTPPAPPPAPPPRPLEWADLSPSALPYLHAVAREALRLYPPAALGTGRVVTGEAGGGGGGETICGADVPPGTVVMLPIYVASRRTSTYGPDAAEFRPERWLPDDPSQVPPEPPTFSHGPRDCVGMPLAKAELLAAVAALVAAFRWRPAARVLEGGGLEGLLHFRITLGTESGMPLLFEPR